VFIKIKEWKERHEVDKLFRKLRKRTTIKITKTE